MANKSIGLSTKQCLHGGDYDKCTGQCKESITVEGVAGVFFCLLDKGHSLSHHYSLKGFVKQ